jgi:hypothetical protein
MYPQHNNKKNKKEWENRFSFSKGVEKWPVLQYVIVINMLTENISK